MKIMGNISNIKKWELETYEMAAGYEPVLMGHYPTGRPLKLHIPKIMPHISAGTPRIIPSSLSSGCYANDSSCKPHVPSTVSTQNYITVPFRANRRLSLPWLRIGAPVQVEIANKDVDDIFVSTKVDNSKLLP